MCVCVYWKGCECYLKMSNFNNDKNVKDIFFLAKFSIAFSLFSQQHYDMPSSFAFVMYSQPTRKRKKNRSFFSCSLSHSHCN